MKNLPFFPKSTAIPLLFMAAVTALSLPAVAADKGKRPLLPAPFLNHHGAPAKATAHSPNVATINIPGAELSYAFGVNNKGEIVGYWYDDQSNTHGFLDSGGKITNIDLPNTLGIATTGINDQGIIVGTFANESVTLIHGFLFYRGQFALLDYPGAFATTPTAINDAGDVVGYYQIKDDPNSPFIGFLWRKGTFTSFTVPGSVYTFPAGINDRGDIVGGWYDQNNSHAFLLSKGVYTTLDPPGAFSAIAGGINSSGKILLAATLNDISELFIYSDGTYQPITVPGADLYIPGSINSRGEITGAYAFPTTSPVAFMLKP